MDYLDLQRHSPEEFDGKAIHWNGRDYVLYRRIGQGGEAIVYALLNMLSRQIDLVAKIFHFLPDSPEYERVKNHGLAMFVLGAAAQEADTQTFQVEPMEVQELSGGVVGFQRYLGYVETQWDCADLVNRSAEMIKIGDNKGALQVTDEILRDNQYHTGALLTRANALIQLKEYVDALRLILHASEIEPNSPTFAITGAELALAIGQPHRSLMILSNMLKRWKYHYPIWRKLVEVATDHDLCEEADPLIDFGLDIVNDDETRAAVAASRSRSLQFREVLFRAYEAQLVKDWQLGLSLCRDARRLAKSNHFAILNEYVCRYWLAIKSPDSDELASIVQQLWGPPRLSALLLLFFCQVRSGSIEMAVRIAGALAALVEDPIDLPRLPIIVTEKQLREEETVEPIEQALRQLLDQKHLEGDQANSLQQLLAKYRQLDVLTEEAVKRMGHGKSA